MTDGTASVENRDKLIALFGDWPSFHDAEVIDLHYWRGDIKPGDWDDRNVFPVLTVKIRILRATQPDFDGENKKDAIVTLRFHDVGQFEMDGFNHVNQIIDLSIATDNQRYAQPYHHVVFERGFGMQASFHCFRIEVLDTFVALPTD